jgi:hypothetical protein
MAADPSATLFGIQFSQWFQRINSWTSAWNYNALDPKYDDAGNFTFGATGKALGLPASAIMWGGGLKKNYDYWSKGEPNPYFSFPYTNAPHKMLMIAQGIQYAQNGCNHH